MGNVETPGPCSGSPSRREKAPVQLPVFLGSSLRILIRVLPGVGEPGTGLLSPGSLHGCPPGYLGKECRAQPRAWTEPGTSPSYSSPATTPSLGCSCLCVSFVSILLCPACSRCLLTIHNLPSQAAHDSKSHRPWGFQALITFVFHHKERIREPIIWSCTAVPRDSSLIGSERCNQYQTNHEDQDKIFLSKMHWVPTWTSSKAVQHQGMTVLKFPQLC